MKEKIYVEIHLEDGLSKKKLKSTLSAIGMIKGVSWTMSGPAEKMSEEARKDGIVYEVV